VLFKLIVTLKLEADSLQGYGGEVLKFGSGFWILAEFVELYRNGRYWNILYLTSFKQWHLKAVITLMK